MIAHSKPIAFPSHNSQLAYAEGSYTDGGAFNPASFTRHFLGSPISCSFGNRFPASPTAQLLSSIDVSGKTPVDDSILNAVNVFEREGELCRNYTCCNLPLNDLHALLEHFEQVHIVVLDPTSTQPQAHIQVPFNPTVHDTKKPYVYDPDDMELDIDLDTHSPLPPPPPPPSSRQSSVQSSPSSGAPSPPDTTPASTPLSTYPSPHPFIPHHLPNQTHFRHPNSPYISQPPSPLSTTYDPTTASSTRQNSPTSTTPNHLNLNFNLTSHHGFPRATPPTNLPNPEEAFNPYARFASDYSSSMPGALFNGATVDEASALHGATAWQVQQQQQHQQLQEGCVPPALLFASGSGNGRVPSPTHKHQTGGHHSKNNLIKTLSSTSLHRHQHHHQHQHSSTSSPSSSRPTSPTSTNAHPHPLSRPASSLLLCKPFRCPKPNCNKSYKQANGLKYHMTHGSCNFAPPKDLEHVKDLLERKRREREGMTTNGATTGSGLTRSTSLGSAPATVQHHHVNQSMTTPSTPTASSHPSPTSTSTTPSTTPPPAASSSSTPSPPSTGPSPPALSYPVNDRLSPSSILTYSDLSNISEHDLREVEREAERRLRPFACGVGECQRRYKNMNGLRYHYQHSGEHGAMGLALLASGQHECLSAGRRNAAAASASNGGIPTSRGGSVSVGSSRTGTPQPFGVVDVKTDVTVSTTAVPMGVRNTSPSRTHVQVQAQAYHQLQLQQFQQQQQMQIRDQQHRQQQQTQTQSHNQNQPQQDQRPQQPQHTQHQHHLAAYHYAHMQRQYQAHIHAAQQKAQAQQQQQQQKSPLLSSPTHSHPNPNSPLGHSQNQSPQTTTFPSSSNSPAPVGGTTAGGGVSSPNMNGSKSPTIPMDLDLGMGFGMGMGMGVDMGLGTSPVGSAMGGFNSGMNMGMGLNLGFDNGIGSGAGDMGYGGGGSGGMQHLGMMNDLGLHPMSSGGGGHHHHHHQTYSNGNLPTRNHQQQQQQNGVVGSFNMNGMDVSS